MLWQKEQEAEALKTDWRHMLLKFGWVSVPVACLSTLVAGSKKVEHHLMEASSIHAKTHLAWSRSSALEKNSMELLPSSVKTTLFLRMDSTEEMILSRKHHEYAQMMRQRALCGKMRRGFFVFTSSNSAYTYFVLYAITLTRQNHGTEWEFYFDFMPPLIGMKDKWFSADVYFGYKYVLMLYITGGLISFLVFFFFFFFFFDIFKSWFEWKGKKKKKGKISWKEPWLYLSVFAHI